MNSHQSPQPKRIRVVRIIDRLNIGGPTKHVTWLTAGLDAEEFETTLIIGTVPPTEGDMGEYARAAGIRPILIKEMSRELGLSDAIVAYKLWRLLRQIQPDIIHTHKAKAGAVGRTAAMLYRWLTPSSLWFRPRPCRVAHTYHGHVFHSYYGGLKTKLIVAIERTLARLCTDRIITISEQQRREIHEDFSVGHPAQFRVIPLGIECEEASHVRPSKSLRAEYGIQPDEFAVGIVGRLCEVKNHAMFLQAVACLLKTAPTLGARTKFFVLGDGHLREELETLSQSLGIANQVIFTGFRNDVVALYEELDLVALTSLNEGTPLTLIEAMNGGCAIVSTEVGGVVDIMGQRRAAVNGLQQWEHGLTVPSGDVSAFARALEYLLERTTLRQKMGIQGRTFVRSHLSRERLVRDVSNLYREMLTLND